MAAFVGSRKSEADTQEREWLTAVAVGGGNGQL
jgi:hypothetical protein